MAIETTPALVQQAYDRTTANLETVRERLGRPLSYAEKVLLGHLADAEAQELDPGESYLLLRPDRIAMQDATAQMALLQFMQAGRDETAVPTTVHCDHLIQAYKGAAEDMETAKVTNGEVYDFLRSCSARYGIGFWGPGAGIIHQVVLENYAFPGGMMIGTDSHTPNAGGLGMFACGVGGADAVDVMADFPWEVLYPKLVGVHLTGELSGWASPKDVILHVCKVLTVKGGTNRVVEYFGPGAASISCTGKGTITNMGAELGATTSLFPFDESMAIYLKATRREELADLARANEKLLRADPEVEADPGRFFDEVVEIDLSKLEPYIVGPHTPDLARPISQMKADCEAQGYATHLTHALIGSCTNSSYEDMSRAADVARGHAGLGADPPDDPARRPDGGAAVDRRRRSGQRLRPVHRPVAARRPGRGRAELDHQLLQPQLPQAQRRQSRHAVVHRLARGRYGLRAGRDARVRSPDRRARRAERSVQARAAGAGARHPTGRLPVLEPGLRRAAGRR
jgi:aconitate hydratase